MILSELVDEYGANGVIRIDEGQGSAGPSWIDWCADDTDLMDEIADVEMTEVNPRVKAYPEDSNQTATYYQVVRYVIPDYETDIMYASDWIKDDKDYHNPYRYRLIF